MYERDNQKTPQGSEDVKFVAYDGTVFITEMVEPPLTAIVQPIRELARESVRLVCNLGQWQGLYKETSR